MKLMITIILSILGAVPAYVAGSLLCASYLAPGKISCKKALQTNWKMAMEYVILAAIGGFLFTKYQYPPTQIILCFLVMYTVIAVARIDWNSCLIPNKAVLFLMASKLLLLIVDFFVRKEEWLSLLIASLVGLLIGGITFLAGYVISRQGMGLGDVKLLAAIGFCMGDSTAVMIILVSLVFAAVCGGIQMARKKLSGKDSMPFAPFVAAASVLLLMLGF